MTRRKKILKSRAETNKIESKIESKITTQNINETKIWFCGKINKTDKPLTRFIKEKEALAG